MDTLLFNTPTGKEEKRAGNAKSTLNSLEAEAVVREVQRIKLVAPKLAKDMVVLTPYRAQLKELADRLPELQKEYVRLFYRRCVLSSVGGGSGGGVGWR